MIIAKVIDKPNLAIPTGAGLLTSKPDMAASVQFKPLVDTETDMSRQEAVEQHNSENASTIKKTNSKCRTNMRITANNGWKS